MASSFKFNQPMFHRSMKVLQETLLLAGEEGMQKVVDQAADDARQIQHWREPGPAEEDYPSGHWEWEVTGMAAASIQGYVVPNKKLHGQPSRTTISHWNGIALRHPHSTDDSVTGDHNPDPGKVIGIVTMNIAYAPYLQDYERREGETPVVVEVFDTMWSQVYIPTILRPAIEKAMARVAHTYI